MSDPLHILAILAIAATVIVLAIGIGGFGAGGAFNAKYGNKMMRLRILFQFIAVVLFLGYLYLSNQGGQ
ncbi:twin transmembrane helix small protein [Phaeobacter italicus]|uniref:twin transmembrane helix small protein n=1 Tax=Phaeobacter italicus TaxID=481446 RepID=UPI001CD1F567|nr:twin transmembrane helix small protein [Phaeobacter italicus]MCA0858435.1 twin transmembrane helix small protein [Phaeobacter italicus]